MNTDNGSGGAIRRFAGSGADAYRDYRSWKKWARAYLIVQRAKGTPATALGPMLFTLLDDVAARALEVVDMDELEQDGGESLIFDTLDSRFPDVAAHDRLG